MAMTEDEVRDSAKKILGFDKTETGVQQGTGQITTFNQLGITGEGKDRKPDGWYLPEDKGRVAIILEAKNGGENLGKKAHTDELLRNCRIVLDAGWKNVVGLLHNGTKTKGYINNIDIEVPDALQDKSYYFKLVTDKGINKGMIYTLTARINNCLHTEFGVKNLYHRMIFTACALVAERYGARLSKVKDMGYEVFHTAIRKQLEAALENDKQQNRKLETLLDVYSGIKMNVKEKQKAINDFIDWVIAISDCITSNQWHGEDVMGIFFNEFNRYKKKSDAGQVFTPDHITSFMYRLIGVTKEDYVGDFACGSGAFLVKAMSNMIEEAGGVDTKEAKEIRQTHLFGIEFDREIYALACANMLIHKDGKTNLAQLDTREKEACDWIKSKPITKVLMNPPFETKYGCVKIVKNVLDSVKRGADCAFIMPDKKLEKSSKRLVADILEHHRLMMIVKLPENLFFGVGVTASVFVFKAGEPQKGKEIFGCYIEDDGLETVKNKGRHDVKGRWGKIEDYWVEAIEKRNDPEHGTHQWLKPSEHLSYQMQEKKFEIYERDFFKTALDYEMYRRGIQQKEFVEALLQEILYSSGIGKRKGHIVITLGRPDVSADSSEAPLAASPQEDRSKPVETRDWKQFKIQDLFSLDLSKGDNQAQKLNEGDIPLVSTLNTNNGICAYVNEGDGISEMYPAGILTVDMFGQAYYQNEDFYAVSHGHVNMLTPKFRMSEMSGLYLATILRATFCGKYGFLQMCTQKVLKSSAIPLPVDADGAPDWQYMEDCMKRVETRAKKTMDCLLA